MRSISGGKSARAIAGTNKIDSQQISRMAEFCPNVAELE
jgi:hypothetical protein